MSLLDYAPYVFVEGKQPVKGVITDQSSTELVNGYSWEVFIESFLAMGYSIEYTIVPWPRAIRLLEYGHADLFFLSVNLTQDYGSTITPKNQSTQLTMLFIYQKTLLSNGKVMIH